MLTTSFRRLYEHEACIDRYRHLARALGGIKKYGRTTPITLLQILKHNGLEDALWSLPTVPDAQKPEMERVARLFACWCARNTPLPDGRTAWNLLTDERSRNAIEVAERFAVGDATDDELSAARAAAWAADWAARDAARATAWAAARDAAWAAAWAARDAARDAAWAAARDAQKEFLEQLLKEQP